MMNIYNINESFALIIDRAINLSNSNPDYKKYIINDIIVNPQNVKKYGLTIKSLLEDCVNEKAISYIDLMEYLIVHNESMAKFFGTEKFQKFILKIFDRCKLDIVKERLWDLIKLCADIYNERSDMYYDLAYSILKIRTKCSKHLKKNQENKRLSMNISSFDEDRARSSKISCIQTHFMSSKKKYSFNSHDSYVRNCIKEAKSNSMLLVELLDNSYGGKYLKCDIDIQITLAICKTNLKNINKIIEEGSSIYNTFLLNSVLKCCDLLNLALKEYKLLLKGKRVHKIKRKNLENHEFDHIKKFKGKETLQLLKIK